MVHILSSSCIYQCLLETPVQDPAAAAAPRPTPHPQGSRATKPPPLQCQQLGRAAAAASRLYNNTQQRYEPTANDITYPGVRTAHVLGKGGISFAARCSADAANILDAAAGQMLLHNEIIGMVQYLPRALRLGRSPCGRRRRWPAAPSSSAAPRTQAHLLRRLRMAGHIVHQCFRPIILNAQMTMCLKECLLTVAAYGRRHTAKVQALAYGQMQVMGYGCRWQLAEFWIHEDGEVAGVGRRRRVLRVIDSRRPPCG